MEMDAIISKAIGIHSKWTYHIKQAVKTEATEYDPAIVKTDNSCEFGKWLYNDAPPELKRLPIYREIKDIHARFHVEASRVLTLALSGKKYEAIEAIRLGSEYEHLSSILVLKLASLKPRKNTTLS